MMKKYKIDRSLETYLFRIIRKGYGTCSFVPIDDKTSWCYTTLPSDLFHKYVLRARCEKRTYETGTLFMTDAEYRDGIVRRELIKEHGMPHYLCVAERA